MFQEFLKHLFWLFDSKDVYEAALGPYYLKLAAIVESKSQRGPKVYFLFLLKLDGMPDLLMQYNPKLERKLVIEAWGYHLSKIHAMRMQDAATIYLSCFSLEKSLKAFCASNLITIVWSVGVSLKLFVHNVLISSVYKDKRLKEAELFYRNIGPKRLCLHDITYFITIDEFCKKGKLSTTNPSLFR